MFQAVNWAQRRERAGDVNPRVYVRQGRFAEAYQIIEASHRRELDSNNNARPPRSHRESSAMLAWTDIMVGEAENARTHAAESMEIGQLLGSPVVECIAMARVGLAWLTGHDYDPARATDHFTDAIRLAERIGVARFKVEPLLGMTIVHGLEGFPDRAETSGREALVILKDTGDEYVRGVVCAALGAALVQSNGLLAESWLMEAEQLSERCGDRFVHCVAALWLAIHFARTGQPVAARQNFARALERAQEHGFSFLFSGTPLLAPKEFGLIRTLLRRAQEHATHGEYARELIQQLEPNEVAATTAVADSLATAALYIQTLGPFRVWRKGQEIERSAWSREKALHLLQLLVCNRARAVHRDEIIQALWDGSTSSTATTGMRVALSALRSALDPEREPGADSAFVRRDGDAIRLALESGVRVDADEFSRLLKAARALETSNIDEAVARYERALAMYRGEFMADNRYAEWAEAERQERRREFLVHAERLAVLLLKTEEYERAARWAETMLQQDALWEGAYTLLMEAYWRQGNRALAVRAFNRCQKRLRDALGVAPSSRTLALLARVSQPDARTS
jgi:DNA-binding SARP family transcriptional activator